MSPSRAALIEEMVAAERLGSDRSPEARMSRALDAVTEELTGVVEMLQRGGVINLIWAASEKLVDLGEEPTYKEAIESLGMARDTHLTRDRPALILHGLATITNLLMKELENLENEKLSDRVGPVGSGRLRVLSKSQLKKRELERSRLHAGKNSE